MATDYDSLDTEIPVLGEATIPSPLTSRGAGSRANSFVEDSDRLIIDVNFERMKQRLETGLEPKAFEMAGPREKIYFDSKTTRCALVTCGGLCPGLNDIVRAIVFELTYGYGVTEIYGIRYGLQGFIPEFGHEVIELTAKTVASILDMGGSVLGSSRGPQDMDVIVDRLDELDVNILFMIGGDGTMTAAQKIADTVTARNLDLSVVGIPKTIDNDIYLVARSFGFDTAVSVATDAIKAAHNEARGFFNGIGLIKLMGRHSGFIAATATLAQQEVNFVFIPEIDFDLDGPNGFLAKLEDRLAERRHAVIVAAEGAGQKFFSDAGLETDASGNATLKDIGLYLKERILAHFEEKGIEVSLKYIDPSYTIRGLPANPNDSIFCGFLGRDAVHAGMAGKTKLIIGHWNNHFVHIPMKVSAGKRKQVGRYSKLWRTVLESTGQGSFKNRE